MSVLFSNSILGTTSSLWLGDYKIKKEKTNGNVPDPPQILQEARSSVYLTMPMAPDGGIELRRLGLHLTIPTFDSSSIRFCSTSCESSTGSDECEIWRGSGGCCVGKNWQILRIQLFLNLTNVATTNSIMRFMRKKRKKLNAMMNRIGAFVPYISIAK